MTSRPPRATPRPRRTTARPQPAATAPSASEAPAADDALTLAILRYLRRTPNRAVDLGPLANELGVDPSRMQLVVERLHQRRLVIAPFIEPGTAGGAELTEQGSRWLLDREGGTPSEPPVALQPASDRVRAADEAARLPRAQVYGTRRS